MGDTMRKLIFFLLLAIWPLATGNLALANNIRVENVSFYKAADQPAGTIDIKFDVVWDNSFGLPGTDLQDANSQSYYDRAWIFVKFWDSTQMNSANPWGHAILTTGGSLSTYNVSTGIGLSPVEGAGSMGAFAVPGTNQTVRWNYAATLIPGFTSTYVTSSDTVKVRVMAIEMVRIPMGSFDLGDGNGTLESTNAFHVAANTKLTIGTSLVQHIRVIVNGYDDDVIEGVVGSNTGIGIKGDGGIDYSVPEDGVIDNPSFPTGYNAFYCMKYEVSQGQYRDFLNMLTRVQQTHRAGSGTTLAFGTTSVTNRYVMPNTPDAANISSANNYRNGIRCDATIPVINPITFYCDYNNNGTPNESDDGEWIACNYLSWADLCAFADWAGLRPMTELEFEKASRGGGITAIYQDWAGGTYATIDYFSNLIDAGKISEAKGATRANANCNISSAAPDGPIRCGMFSTSSSTRTQSGASYYGLMEMSGNLWERCVTAGNGTSGNTIGGRAFTGTHGDGTLTTLANYEGNATNSDWPGYYTNLSTRGIYDATGSGYRGGGWYDGATYARVSDRYYAAYSVADRSSSYGARLARTSP